MKIRYYKGCPKTKIVMVLKNDWKCWFETGKGFEEAKKRYNLKDNDFIYIDYNIFKHVQLLNEKGYKTIYSCEGHRRKYNERTIINYMYIVILVEDNFDKYSNYLIKAPDDFYVSIEKLHNVEDDKRAKTVVIQQQRLDYDKMNDKEYFNKVKKENLDSLYKFIEQLPDISKDIDKEDL